MLNFSEWLNEIFDGAVSMVHEPINPKKKDVRVLSWQVDQLTYKLIFSRVLSDYWQVKFEPDLKTMPPELKAAMRKQRKGRYKVLGFGNEFKVFNGVLRGMKEFMDSQDKTGVPVNRFTMYAAEENRFDLYMRLLKKYLPEFDITSPTKGMIVANRRGSPLSSLPS